jgi:TetR/AcrR family transcriptional regulator
MVNNDVMTNPEEEREGLEEVVDEVVLEESLPVDDGDSDESEGEGASMELETAPPRRSRRDKKRKKLLEAASSEYGGDVVRKLENIKEAKERIVFVAESVFARKGFAGARTQEIADLAGVNKAMIHYYFDNKEKLYHAVLDKLLFDLIKLTQESVRDRAGFAEQLDLFYRGFFDYIATHRNFSRLSAMERGSGDRYLSRMVETFFKPLFDRGVDFINRGASAGVFDKKVNPRQYLVSVYGMTIGYFADAEFVAQLLGDDPLTDKMLKERREALLQMVFDGLGCKRP